MIVAMLTNASALSMAEMTGGRVSSMTTAPRR